MSTATVNATRTLRVALAGNPNSGKTSLFNGLTGARQKVGNYPGVTVERRSGSFNHRGCRMQVTDLPGTYSLSSHSPEERIAQQELLSGQYDAIVVVVDSTALRRSFGLVAQVMLTGVPCVLALNMSDEAEQAGIELDADQLSSELGMPVVRTVGHRDKGIEELCNALQRSTESPAIPRQPDLGSALNASIQRVAAALEVEGALLHGPHWVAMRLLAGEDLERHAVLGNRDAGQRIQGLVASERSALTTATGHDIDMVLVNGQRHFAHTLLERALKRDARPEARATTRKLDAVLAHRIWGLPIFAAIMYLMFELTFTVGAYPMQWIEAGQEGLGGWIAGFWAEGSDSQLKSLLVDGVIGGVGAVVIFLPNILILFICIAILESTGYMARAAFLLDRLMHKVGLHGKSFVPMISGFGCTIPAIMATRTLENERDRIATIMVLPLMSCGARLPIWLVIVPAMFSETWQTPVLFGIYASGILLAFILAWLLRGTVLKGEQSPFVMELPPYRAPTIKALFLRAFDRGMVYLKKAGTVILAFAIVMWALSTYPQTENFAVDAQVASGEVQLSEQEIENERAAESLENSVLGTVGMAIAPAFEPIGMDWRMSTATLAAFPAKELFVAQLGVVYSMGEADEESDSLKEAIAKNYTPLAAISVMLFLLISTPCMATVAVTRRETGKWSYALLQFFGLTGIGYLIALAVYQIGSMV